MTTALKQENDTIKINQFITDKNGHKVAAIIEIGELKRLKEIIEDLSDIKAFKDKKSESKEAFKKPVIKTKAFRVVKPIQGKGIPASELFNKGQAVILYYLDASAWVKRYYQEDGTSWVQNLFTHKQVLVCSSLGMIEVMATLSRKRKALEISLSQFKLKAQELEGDWKHFIQIQMTDEIVHIAKELTKKLSLRGYDAVHLSSALLLQRHFVKKGEQLFMVTSDHELKEAAKSSRLDIIDPTEQIDINKS